jgi:imidazole glycerol phosphate synthase subunit hisH (EC 2.4.2.-)
MIAILDYEAGNIASVENALEKLGYDFVLTQDPKVAEQCSHLILPGQGRAGMAMKNLQKQNLISLIQTTTKPFLGICLGMQLLANWSEEDQTQCLGIIPGQVKRFTDTDLKVPHMGWNNVQFEQSSPLLLGIPQNTYFYFVHSYYFDTDSKYVSGTTQYGHEFAAIVVKKNFFATQFHPEKSGSWGLQLLKNFLGLT